jgi:hypothetical protein
MNESEYEQQTRKNPQQNFVLLLHVLAPAKKTPGKQGIKLGSRR